MYVCMYMCVYVHYMCVYVHYMCAMRFVARFDDAGFYYWLLTKSALESARKEAQGEGVCMSGAPLNAHHPPPSPSNGVLGAALKLIFCLFFIMFPRQPAI